MHSRLYCAMSMSTREFLGELVWKNGEDLKVVQFPIPDQSLQFPFLSKIDMNNV